MQLKNNQTRNAQFFFWKKEKDGSSNLEVVHIPGGATVELDDDVFRAITSSVTKVEELAEVEIKLDDESIGADLKVGKEVLTIKEYMPTGKFKSVNLMKEAIKAGDFTIVQRAEVSAAAIDEVLKANGIDVSKMEMDAKVALYDKLV